MRYTISRRRVMDRMPKHNGIFFICDLEAPGNTRQICEGEEWDKRREEVWRRDEGRCRCCGDPVPLHKEKGNLVVRFAAEIHHLRKRKSGGSERDDRPFNLITFCWKCHKGVEEARISIESVPGVVKFWFRGIVRFAATRQEINALRAECTKANQQEQLCERV